MWNNVGSFMNAYNELRLTFDMYECNLEKKSTFLNWVVSSNI